MRILKISSLALLWTLMPLAPAAQAGPYTDELSKCLVQLSTEDDKLKLVKWMFSSMALHPAVAEIAQVTAADRDIANREMADLLGNLLEERCFDQARAAITNEGPVALQSSFSILGQVAANELFSNPNVAAGLGSLAEYLDAATLDKKLGIGEN